MKLYGLFLIFLATSLLGQDPSTTSVSRQLTLDECLHSALENNYNIHIAMTEPRIAQYDLSGSFGIYEPTLDVVLRRDYSKSGGFTQGGQIFFPTEENADSLTSSIGGGTPWGMTYDVGYNMREIENREGGTNIFTRTDYIMDTGIQLTQPLLRGFWIDQTRAQIRISRNNLRISEYEVQLQMMRTVRDVSIAYYDLIAALDQVKVQEKAVELSQQLFEENQKRVRAGVLAVLDEKQAQSQLKVAQANLIAARRTVLFQENVLKNLITRKFAEWQSVRIQPAEKLLALPETYDRGESWMSALTKRPDFGQVRSRVENQGIQVKLAKNQVFPTLNLIGGYGRAGFGTVDFSDTWDDIPADDNPHYYAGTVLSIPLFNRLERNRHRSAKETLHQLELVLEQLHQTILVEVDDAITLAEANFQQIPALREAQLYADAALKAEQKKLENGKSTSFFVLQYQRDLITASAEEIRALAEYNKALAQYYYSEGTILDRHKINVQFR